MLKARKLLASQAPGLPTSSPVVGEGSGHHTPPALSLRLSAAWAWTSIHLSESQFLHQETQEEK